MFNASFPQGTKIIYTITENGTFFEVIFPKPQNQSKVKDFDGNLIKAILEYETYAS